MTKFTLLLTLLFTSCGLSKYDQALDQAGDNRVELEKVITHYDSLGDDAKKKAALFLIENMSGKQSVVFRDTAAHAELLHYFATIHDPIGWDPLYSTVSKTMDSVIRSHSVNITINNDLQTMTAKYMMQNIDKAFHAWNKAPWSKNYTFDEFCQYVLPYKLGHEAMDDWRMTAMPNKAPAEDSLLLNGKLWDIAVALINNTGLYYNVGMGSFPYPMNFTDINTVRLGACGQMANLAAYYFRSRAVPSAIDFTPAWANRSSSHVWNAVILPGGKSKSIGYRPDGTNDMAYKVSKIYRKTYEVQSVPTISEHEVLPLFFSSDNMIDVTEQYDMPLSDVTVDLSVDAPVKNVYLATFNNNSWVPVAISEKDDLEATFKHMGRGVLPKGSDNMIRYINQGNGIVYLPVYSLQQGLSGAGVPFILDTLGGIRRLEPSKQTEKVRLYRKYPKHPKYTPLSPNERTPDDNDVIIGQEYELLYWDGKWVSLGRKTAEDYSLDYDVPKNALLWLRNHTKGVEERIFTIDNGTQVWW